MELVATSSRGFNPGPHLPAGTVLEAIPGGKLKTLVPKALKLIPPSYKVKGETHVYFLCGV